MVCAMMQRHYLFASINSLYSFFILTPGMDLDTENKVVKATPYLSSKRPSTFKLKSGNDKPNI